MRTRRPSTIAVAFRSVMMLVALGMVMHYMGYLKNNPIGELFFNPEGAMSRPKNRVGGKINLCPTRVGEIRVLIEGKEARFFQQGIKWLMETDNTYELEPLFMEKWLAAYCEVQIEEFVGAAPDDQAYDGELHLKYIDGTEAVFKRVEPGVFLSQGEHIRSGPFEEAFEALDPEAGK